MAQSFLCWRLMLMSLCIAFPQLFDVRAYANSLNDDEIALVGARCAGPNDASLSLFYDIETPILRMPAGCDPDIDAVPSNGGHTYGSGAFTTFWLAPRMSDDEKETTDGGGRVFYDVSEGQFDEEHFFQQAKVQQYAWERWYFETDMIAGAQYRLGYAPADYADSFSSLVYRNPCRYMHQHNNGWLFPFYGGDAIPKWEPDAPGSAFDIELLYQSRGHDGFGFVVHETFHGFQGELGDTYGSGGGRWLAESTASFGCDYAFPAVDTYAAPYTIAPGVPLNMCVLLQWDLLLHYKITCQIPKYVASFSLCA